MDWKNQFTKTPYLVLFVILISGGMTGAYAITITLDGDVISYLGTLDMNGNKITNVGTPTTSTDLVTKGYADQGTATDTLALLSCSTNQIPKWSGTQWECSDL